MDAIILVGGQGTRLRPLTARRHKSLLPVCNRPAFDYLLDWCEASGFSRVVLALGQHNEDLATAYPDGPRNGLTVSVVMEHEPLQSGGGIRYAAGEAAVNGRFVVLNGDVFVEFDFREMLLAHERAGADLSIALHVEQDASQYGVATVDDRSLITRFVEKSPEPPSNLVNAGVWIFEQRSLAEIPPGAVRVEETLFPDLVDRGRPVVGHVFSGLWADIGTPQRYLDLNLALIDRGVVSLDPSVEVGRGASIQRASVGPGCRLGPGASVTDSVLWEGVRLGEGAIVGTSVLADSVEVGPGATLDGVVVGPGTRIRAGASAGPGTVIPADTIWGG